MVSVKEVFESVGAILTNGHFVYTSGRHGSAYVNKNMLYPHTEKTSYVCRLIAEKFMYKNVQVVVAPALGGIILSQWVAFHLSKLNREEVLSVYAEKDGDSFKFSRDQDKLIKNKNILIVEDVLTTGGSVKKVIELTRTLSGNIVGLGVLCNRGNVTPEQVGGVPELFALMNLEFQDWDEEECPLCAEGVPVNTNVGKGKEFIGKKQMITLQ